MKKTLAYWAKSINNTDECILILGPVVSKQYKFLGIKQVYYWLNKSWQDYNYLHDCYNSKYAYMLACFVTAVIHTFKILLTRPGFYHGPPLICRFLALP